MEDSKLAIPAINLPDSEASMPNSSLSLVKSNNEHGGTSNSPTSSSHPRSADQSHTEVLHNAVENDEDSMDEDTMLQIALALSISETNATSQVQLNAEDSKESLLEEQKQIQDIVTVFDDPDLL